MTTLFEKPKAPDNSKQQALLAEQDSRLQQQEAETRRRDAASLAARRGRNASRSSLITGGETGVARETLG
jgi:hypothetical protein